MTHWAAPSSAHCSKRKEYRYFKVAASDGDTYILRHDEASGEWTLGAFRKGGG